MSIAYCHDNKPTALTALQHQAEFALNPARSMVQTFPSKTRFKILGAPPPKKNYCGESNLVNLNIKTGLAQG